MRKINLKIISDNGSLEFNKPYLSQLQSFPFAERA